jgi:hypothetical protein
MENKGKYYSFIVSQLANIKYLYIASKSTIKKSIIPPVDEEEFNRSWDWAIADTFGNGCDYETK